METIKKVLFDFWARPVFTTLDVFLFMFIGIIQVWWFTVPSWLWIIIGSTLVTHKYYKVEKKEAN